MQRWISVEFHHGANTDSFCSLKSSLPYTSCDLVPKPVQHTRLNSHLGKTRSHHLGPSKKGKTQELKGDRALLSVRSSGLPQSDLVYYVSVLQWCSCRNLVISFWSTVVGQLENISKSWRHTFTSASQTCILRLQHQTSPGYVHFYQRHATLSFLMLYLC